MGEYITTFFMALLFLGPIIVGALYYIFLGVLYVWAAITDFFDAIITPFTKEGKESRKKSKNIKNFEKLFKKLRNFKKPSELPDDTALLQKMAARFEKEGDPDRSLTCYKKSSDLGCEIGSYHAARLLWNRAADSLEVLNEAERYALLSVERRGGSAAERLVADIRRSIAVQEGVNACNERRWDRALEHLREAISIGLDKEYHVEEAAKCYCHAAMAQMECAVTFRDWEQAYFYATEPGLEKTSFARRLKELENQITSRGGHHLKPVLELLTRAAQAMKTGQLADALRIFHEAAERGSSAAVCRGGMLMATIASSVSECDRAMEQVQKGAAMGYPWADDIISFVESRRICIQGEHTAASGNRELAINTLKEQALKRKDGQIALTTARLLAEDAKTDLDWSIIQGFLKTARNWQDPAQELLELERRHAEGMTEYLKGLERLKRAYYNDQYEETEHLSNAMALGIGAAAYELARYKMELIQRLDRKHKDRSTVNSLSHCVDRLRLLKLAKILVERAASMNHPDSDTLLPEIEYQILLTEDQNSR